MLLYSLLLIESRMNRPYNNIPCDKRKEWDYYISYINCYLFTSECLRFMWMNFSRFKFALVFRNDSMTYFVNNSSKQNFRTEDRLELICIDRHTSFIHLWWITYWYQVWHQYDRIRICKYTKSSHQMPPSIFISERNMPNFNWATQLHLSSNQL